MEMFETLSQDVIQRYLRYLTAAPKQQYLSTNFLSTFFEKEFLQTGNLLSAPLHIVMKVTSICNLNCAHCSEKTSFRNELPYMNNWVEIIDRLADMGVICVSLTGGEPLLHLQIKDIIRKCKEKNLIISLLTNGVLIDKEFAQFLSQIFDSRTDIVKISIDNVGEEYEAIRNGALFSQLKEAVALLKQYGINIQATMVVNSANYRHMLDVYRFCVENGISSIRYMPIFEHPNTNLAYVSDADMLLEFDKVLITHFDANNSISIISDPLSTPFALVDWLQRVHPEWIRGIPIGNYICPAGIVSSEIDTSGYVYPCSYLNMNEFVIGKITDADFSTKWVNSQKWSQIRNRVHKNDVCDSCTQKDHCLGGCPASSLYRFGSFGKGDANCPYTREGGFCYETK